MKKATRRHVLFAGVLVLIVGGGVTAYDIATRFEGPRIQESWRSSGIDFDDTDSLAACQLADGRVRVLATAKQGHRVDVFDGETGSFVASYGSEGTGERQFLRPNGIAICDFRTESGATRSAAIVVERDGRRVHAFWVDTLEFAGAYSHESFTRPYGAAIHQADDATLIFVTDACGRPDQRVHVLELNRNGDRIRFDHVESFGETKGGGVLVTLESIAIDADHGHVLLCDEDDSQSNVKVYTLAGEFTGRTFGAEQIQREPEGIAICESVGPGFIILTDQRKEATVWHLYERGTYDYLASFTGNPNVANTDGIAVLAGSFGQFSHGALYAVHDDRDVRAYAMSDVLAILRHTR